MSRIGKRPQRTSETNSVPASREAENGVLSCALQDPIFIIPDIKRNLPEECFYYQESKAVLNALLHIFDDNGPIDHITVAQRLDDTGDLDGIGGKRFLEDLYNYAPSVSHYPTYRLILEDKHLLRRIISSCSEASSIASGVVDDVMSTASHLYQSASSIMSSAMRRKAKSLGDIIEEFHIDYDDALSGKKPPTMETRFPSMNSLMGGLPSGYIIISGENSSGKSTFSKNLSSDGLLKGRPVLVATYEMPPPMYLMRYISDIGGIPGKYLFKPHINRPSREMLRKIRETTDLIKSLPLEIIHDVKMDATMLCDLARAIYAKYNDLIMICDYLQIMPPPKSNKVQSQEAQFSASSSLLRELSKELSGSSIITLSQLTRKEDGSLVTKGATQIVNDADVHLRIDKSHEWFDRKSGRFREYFPLGIYIDKQRNGERDEWMPIFLEGETFQFKESSEKHERNKQLNKQRD